MSWPVPTAATNSINAVTAVKSAAALVSGARLIARRDFFGAGCIRFPDPLRIRRCYHSRLLLYSRINTMKRISLAATAAALSLLIAVPDNRLNRSLNHRPSASR